MNKVVECVEEISKDEFLEALELIENGDRPFLSCDFSKFEKYFEDEDISEADKTALLQTLWNFVVAAMSLNLGVHPMEQAMENCGKDKKSASDAPLSLHNLVDSVNHHKKDRIDLKQVYSLSKKGHCDG
jgi:hypothetical protein